MNLMIDLETLGLNPDSPIISIGACFFDENGPKPLGKHSIFETPNWQENTLNVQDQLDKGRKIDYSTLQWWMKQSNEAKEVFNKKPCYRENKEILTKFANFVNKPVNSLGECEPVKVWGNGATFDITMLESLFNLYEVQVPWSFYNIRDMRTIVEITGKFGIEFKGVPHNALDDALHQARIVGRGMKELKSKGFLF